MFKDVLVAVDGSQHADAALDEAIDRPRTQGARLTLLPAWQAFVSWVGLAPATPISDDLIAEVEQHARQTLDQAVTITRVASEPAKGSAPMWTSGPGRSRLER